MGLNGTPPPNQTPHHYVFGHIALRQAMLGDPYGFFAVMASPQRQELLNDLWHRVCLNCDEAGTAPFDAGAITVDIFQLRGYPTVLIEMPSAHFATEAHMICLVLQVTRQELARQPENPQVCYFTLERAANAGDGEAKTMLCEWAGDSHLNHGEGTALEPAFLESVMQKL